MSDQQTDHDHWALWSGNVKYSPASDLLPVCQFHSTCRSRRPPAPLHLHPTEGPPLLCHLRPAGSLYPRYPPVAWEVQERWKWTFRPAEVFLLGQRAVEILQMKVAHPEILLAPPSADTWRPLWTGEWEQCRR